MAKAEPIGNIIQPRIKQADYNKKFGIEGFDLLLFKVKNYYKEVRDINTIFFQAQLMKIKTQLLHELTFYINKISSNEDEIPSDLNL